jgi:hypothetical protein
MPEVDGAAGLPVVYPVQADQFRAASWRLVLSASDTSDRVNLSGVAAGDPVRDDGTPANT